MDQFSRNGSGSSPIFLNSKRVSKKSVSWRQESRSWRRMLETKYVGDIKDIGDGFGHFGHQHPISFYISVGHQHSKDVTNSEILSRKLKNRQKLQVINITFTGPIFKKTHEIFMDEFSRNRVFQVMPINKS